MNIGIICYPTYGGSGVVASELGLALAERGHQVHFFSTARPFRLPGFKENLFFHEVPVVEYSLFEHTPYTLTLASTLYQAIELYGLEVLHAHYAIPHSVAAYLAKQMGKGKPPVVTTLHGTDITLVGSHPAYVPIVRFAIDQSDGVTAVSHFLADETREKIGVTHDIQVIPNFVDGEFYNRKLCSVRKSIFSPDGEPIVIHISNFRPVKRIGDIMQAFIRVRKEVKCKLLLVGDGPERIRAEQEAREAGITGDVFFLGNQSGVVELLSIGDVYFLPSDSESFGLSALEAMSCEVPVVAARAGGMPEVVKDGECGYLTEVGDVDAMATRLKTLLTDKELNHRMGQAGRARAMEFFPTDKIVTQYEEMYKRLARNTDA